MPDVRAALVYTKRNGLRPPWAIFPLRGKYPAIKGGHGCLDATADPDTITQWWTQYPNANIGLATGDKNGIVVIDVDVGHDPGIDGTETLRDLERDMGKLPDTVEQQTPNGGRHLFFKYPTGCIIGCHKATKDNDPYPGIDVRGNGGYVVVAPSSIRCTDGQYRGYEWEVSSMPNDTPLAELPAPWLKWLIDLCGKTDRFTLPPAKLITKGRRNDTMFSYACQMRANDTPAAEIKAKLAEYNRQIPDPLAENELERIYNSAMKYQPNEKAAAPDQREEREDKPKKSRMTRAILADTIIALGCGVAYNTITCSYEITGRTPSGRAMSQDDLYTTLHDTLAGTYKGVTFDNIAQYAAFEARENSYNPVLRLLDATKWDGTDRMPQLFALMGIEDDELSRILVMKWLYQTVALLFNDAAAPYGADGCLVLNGKQGTGKTSLLRHLALRDEWFGEGCCIDDQDKDTSRRVITKWISELGEVESTLKSDISKLKAFITASMDSYRLPYAKSDTTAPRHTSLCATCNSDRYLIDPTGNRRWWSVPFTRTIPREELLKLDALQLWAGVYEFMKDMPPALRSSIYRLTDAEQAALAERNGEFEKPSKGQDEVSDILAKAEREKLPAKIMTISEFKELWPVLRQYSANQIGVALKRCGIEITHTKRGNTAELPLPSHNWTR